MSGDLSWHAGIPAVFGQQPVTEGNVVVSTRMETFGFDGSWIVAQDLFSGTELWRVKLPINFSDSWRSRVSAIRDGQVYATRSGAGNLNAEYLYALRSTDGSVLWQSQDLVDEDSSESPAFAANGDIIVGNWTSLIRISHTDGTTVWTTPRQCPSGGACAAAVAGDTVYAWDIEYSVVVSAFDVATGSKLYSSDLLGFTQTGLLAGPNGAVYAPMADGSPTDAFIALQDTGSALVERWRVPMGDTPFASFGVGPDGRVYSYSADGRVLRLDPADGTVLNSSAPIFEGYAAQARMAIDAAGKVFVTLGGGATLFSFNADLTLRWSDEVPSVGGPAIGQLGMLIVCGEADVRAYFGANLPASRTAARHLRSGRASIHAPPAVASRSSAPARVQKAPGTTHAPLVAVPAAR
jgi:outer membrane protein assembly factor BamB